MDKHQHFFGSFLSFDIFCKVALSCPELSAAVGESIESIHHWILKVELSLEDVVVLRNIIADQVCQMHS